MQHQEPSNRNMITVTGGSGFIGTKFCSRLLANGSAFQILDIRPSPLFPNHWLMVDICDVSSLETAISGHTIVHLAAEHRDDVRDPSRYNAVNVEGTRNVAKVASAKGINRIVFTSSVAVYGFAPPDTGEDGKIAPFNDYGRTKFEAEDILRRWQQEMPEIRSLTIVRPTVVFGPGNRGNVFNLLSFIGSGWFVMIGSGLNRKSMAYVDNVAAFLDHVSVLGPGSRCFNYIDKPDFTMNKLVSHIRSTLFGKEGVGLRLPRWLGLSAGVVADIAARMSGKSLPISTIRIRKFTATTTFTSTATDLSDFSPPVTLLDGLSMTLEREFLAPDPHAPVFYTE
jgi:nucleoside-diphosphate-sugar epimerase